MVEITVLDRDEQFAAMESAWDGLVACSNEDNPFRRWLWTWTWWKHYGSGRLAILQAWDDGELIGIAPLFIQAEPWCPAGRVLRLLGSTDVCSEYLGLILKRGDESRAVPALLEFLFDQWHDMWDMLRWTDLPVAGVEVPLIETYLQDRGLPYVRRPAFSNLLVRLPESWDQYVAGLSSKRRTKLRKILRDVDSLKAVEVVTADTPTQFPQIWDELRTLHNRHWEEVGQQGLFTEPQFNAFHTEMARAYCDRDQLMLASLRVRDEAVASVYAIRQGEIVYEYQRGHHPSWVDFRPGHALQFQLFRHAIELGTRTWDYLRGDYPHKRDWAIDRRDTLILTIPARRIVAVQRLRLEQTLRTAKRRWARVKDSCWPPARLAKTNS